MVAHDGVLNHVDYVVTRFGLTLGDRSMAVSALHFDMSNFDMFAILAAGGTAVIPRPTPEPAPDQWIELIEEQQLTVWTGVPALVELAADAEGRRPGSLRSLRLVVNGR